MIDRLEPGRKYQLSAWVRQSATGCVTLATYGFDQNDPERSVSASMTEADQWVQLKVAVTPARCLVGVDPWVVVSLEHDGKALAFWSNVTVTVFTSR
ncbi:MAG: hypothetical protein Q7S40_18705 [Opitutaceae bacterium]|nr:hypothetical protein [Opitutaceae bacterium]